MVMENNIQVKEEKKSLIVDMSYHEHSGNFFINFSDEAGCIVSVRVTENQAMFYSNQLGIKVRY